MIYDNSSWGLVHLEMESAGIFPAPGATFPNLDFSAFAQVCRAKGFRAGDPAQLSGAVDAWLGEDGPAILHAIVDPDEIPTMPHIEIGQAARFGISKIKQALRALTGTPQARV